MPTHTASKAHGVTLPKTRNPITLGTFRCTASAREYVNDVLTSGRLTYGPYSQRFERDFARLHDSRFGILSNSGTSALQIALAALKERCGWADGDEVIVPAVTFVATVNIVLHCRMQPVLVDVDPRYYELDPDELARAITPRTRAVIPVHLFGQPADMQPIVEVARRHGLQVIEDSCETMFAAYRGRMCGSIGDIGCFSTYAAHLLVTGVGGICTTSDAELATTLRSLANHGRDGIYFSVDDDDNLGANEMREVIARRFHFTSIGFSYRVTELEAALGVAGLETWESMISRRRENGARLTARLAPLADRIQLPAIREHTQHSFMMYPIVLREEPKKRLVEALEFAGAETRDMLPLTNQPALRRVLDIRNESFPVANWINECGFYVGCHQDLAPEDIDDLASAILAYFE
ncbi:MAG: DegT/DnrJ/EryC1/StrS family aminotransferase [Planctomycetes bacterium]|nr:DegT/DnrJ/EryC1/StrS family aminotransferase [Planctomycetota bacterium]